CVARLSGPLFERAKTCERAPAAASTRRRSRIAKPQEYESVSRRTQVMQGRTQARQRRLKGWLDGHEPQAEYSRCRIRLDRQPVQGGLKPHALQSAATREHI